MSIDFLILVISYLAVVLFIHHYIISNRENNNIVEKKPISIIKKQKKIDVDLESQGGEHSTPIFTEDELSNKLPVPHESDSDEYLKYFSNDMSEIPPFEDKLLKEYSSENFDTKLPIDKESEASKNQLDQYFQGLQVDTVSFTNTVPSGKSMSGEHSNGLLGNIDNSNDVSAFDEFSYSQYSNNYAPIL
jgi:hypothetical protein